METAIATAASQFLRMAFEQGGIFIVFGIICIVLSIMVNKLWKSVAELSSSMSKLDSSVSALSTKMDHLVTREEIHNLETDIAVLQVSVGVDTNYIGPHRRGTDRRREG